jgi:hypothetical protein
MTFEHDWPGKRKGNEGDEEWSETTAPLVAFIYIYPTTLRL